MVRATARPAKERGKCGRSLLQRATHGWPRLRQGGAYGMGANMGVTCKSGKNLVIPMRIGGRGEIRTHDTLAGMPVFKTGALNRSATLPSY
jgi:hypothetical protein